MINGKKSIICLIIAAVQAVSIIGVTANAKENIESVRIISEPRILEVRTNKSECNVNEAVEISLKIEKRDGLDISYVEANFEYNEQCLYGNSSGEKSIRLEYDSLDGLYKGKLKVDDCDEYNFGEYLMNNIQINYLDYSNSSFGEHKVHNYGQGEFDEVRVYVNGRNDKEGPVLKNVTFNKTNLNVGDELKISVQATDKSTISYVNMKLNIENKNIVGINVYGFNYNSAADSYEKTIKIDKKTLGGEYTVENVTITDTYGNTTIVNEAELSKINKIFINNDAIIDITPPELKSFDISTKNAVEGDVVKISVGAEDLESGISVVTVSYIINDFYQEIPLFYNEKSKKYETEISINKYTPSGKWELESIVLGNNEDSYVVQQVVYYTKNYENIYGEKIWGRYFDTTKGDLIINTSGEKDEVSPTLKSVEGEYTSGVVGDKIKFYLDVEERESGIANVYLGVNSGGPQGEKLYVYCKYDESSKKYVGELLITEWMKNSSLDRYDKPQWVLQWINVRDLSGNRAYYDEDIFSNYVVKIKDTDFNKDGKNTIEDLAAIANKYNISKSENRYNEDYDLNSDGIVDIYDVVKVSKTM